MSDQDILDHVQFAFGLSRDDMESVRNMLAREPSVELGVWYFRDEGPREPAVTLFERTR